MHRPTDNEIITLEYEFRILIKNLKLTMFNGDLIPLSITRVYNSMRRLSLKNLELTSNETKN